MLSIRPLAVCLLLLLTACASNPKPGSAAFDTAAVQMKEIYECVWYEHLSGDIPASDALINDAVTVGKAANLAPADMLGIYSRTRSNQKATVDLRAQELAQQRAPKIESISGETLNQPNEAETTQALLELYAEQCDS